jgi:ferritin-like metal-binding protein YciE
LISAAQKVEHYEIASYGCLVTYAKLMQHTEAEELLRQTLEEEKETDVLLTEIAISEANSGAEQEK